MKWKALVRLVRWKELDSKKVHAFPYSFYLTNLTNSFPLTILLLLTGCQWMGNTADSVGSYMPVIGERCEHWQCITPSGQAQSDYNKAAEQHPQQPQAQQPQKSPSSDPWDTTPPPQ